MNIFTTEKQQFIPFVQLAKYFAVKNIINIEGHDKEKRKCVLFIFALHMSLPAIWNYVGLRVKCTTFGASVKRIGFYRQI